VLDGVGLDRVVGLDPGQLLTPVRDFAQHRTPVVSQETSALRVLCDELAELLLIYFA